MNTKAYGLSTVITIAASLSFVTPAANGSSFFMLPLTLTVLAMISAAFGLAGQFGSPATRNWVAERF